MKKKQIIRFVGDIHGKFKDYLELIKGSDKSIQVGDFGIGFGTVKNPVPNPSGDHNFIRGNHDNPHLCKENPHWIKDGTFVNSMFFIGGAFSTDFCLRTESVDWWTEEEMTILELNKLIDVYEIHKPNIVISHDCPRIATPFPEYKINTRTSQALDAMYDIHKPKLWIFGHYHQDIDIVVDGTRFICVNMMKTIDIDISEYQ